jgi:hypothetical protein
VCCVGRIVPAGSGSSVDAVRIPIACSLTADDAETRLDEWRATLTRVVVGAERTAPTELTLSLRANHDELAALVDLVRREIACCSFFEFALHLTAGATTLRVRVPDDAAGVLDGFAQLAG